MDLHRSFFLVALCFTVGVARADGKRPNGRTCDFNYECESDNCKREYNSASKSWFGTCEEFRGTTGRAMTLPERIAACKKDAPKTSASTHFFKTSGTLRECAAGCNAKDAECCNALSSLQAKVCNPAGKCAEFCRDEVGKDYSAAVKSALKCDQAAADTEGQKRGREKFHPK